LTKIWIHKIHLDQTIDRGVVETIDRGAVETIDRGGVESRQEQQNFLFSKTVQIGSGDHPALIPWVPSFLPGVKATGA
jgi:hypothetical protein